jgi:hypothetical protein
MLERAFGAMAEPKTMIALSTMFLYWPWRCQDYDGWRE